MDTFHLFEVCYFIEIIFLGLILIVFLRNGAVMDKLNQALARAEASINAANAKIDALKSNQGIPQADVDAAADKLNAAIDILDAKVAE